MCSRDGWSPFSTGVTATSNGIVVADATTIVIHREGGTQTTAVCGGTPSQKPIQPATLRYTYTLDTSGDVPLLNLTSDGTTTTLRQG